MGKYPKFEKVDKYTIRIILENAKEVPLAQIIANRKQLLQQKKMIEETLEDVDTLLVSAKKLGITAKEKSKDVEKKETSK